MKKAIIIGASSGIGRALAVQMSNDDYELGLTARRINLLEELQEELPNMSFPRYMDVTDVEASRNTLRSLIKEMGDVDIIIYNSGFGHENPDWKIENDIVQINVAGFSVLAKTSYDYFKDKGTGHFVGISSVAGTRGMGLGTCYAASKAFMSNYLKGLRHKITRKKRKIYVTDIRPGFVETPLTKGNEDLMFWTVDAERAARDIYKAIKRKRKTAYIPTRWWFVALLMRSIPGFIWNRF